jgi:hypothetical protein
MTTTTRAHYREPSLRFLGTLADLTLGNNGSCPDGNGDNDQVGGASDCGVSGEANGKLG